MHAFPSPSLALRRAHRGFWTDNWLLAPYTLLPLWQLARTHLSAVRQAVSARTTRAENASTKCVDQSARRMAAGVAIRRLRRADTHAPSVAIELHTDVPVEIGVPIEMIEQQLPFVGRVRIHDQRSTAVQGNSRQSPHVPQLAPVRSGLSRQRSSDMLSTAIGGDAQSGKLGICVEDAL